MVESVRIARLSIRVFGCAHTAWRSKALPYQEYDSREIILDEYRDLTSEISFHCNESLEILEGQHKLTFKVKLPLDVLSSVEKEGFGSIKYTCLAVIDIPEGGGSEITAGNLPSAIILGVLLERDFAVRSLLNVDAPHFLEPAIAREQVNILGLCCHHRRGRIWAELRVAEMGILPGELIRITLSVENTVKKAKAKKHSSKDSMGEPHQCALLSLCQQLDFKSKRRGKTEEGKPIFDERSLTTAVQSVVSWGNGP